MLSSSSKSHHPLNRGLFRRSGVSVTWRQWLQVPRNRLLAVVVGVGFVIFMSIFYHDMTVRWPVKLARTYYQLFPRTWRVYGPNDPKVTMAFILPTTSTGTHMAVTRNISDYVFLKAFTPSLVSSIDPNGRIKYTVYMGIASNDLLLMELRESIRTEFLVQTAGLPVQFRFVTYPQTTLARLYNNIVKQAYADGADYYFITNDDERIETKQWAEPLIQTLENMPFRRNFGVTGPYEYWDGAQPCSGFSFVHRTHLDIFDGKIYDDAFESYGIDTHICDVYAHYGASRVVPEVTFVNHMGDDNPVPRRYKVGQEWRKELPARTALAIQRVDKWLQSHKQ